MTTSVLTWAGLALSFLAAFAFSLFHVCLGFFSKISLSRFLEDREKDFRSGLLRDFDETRDAVEYLRNILLLVFLVYLFAVFPKLRFWPLGFVLTALAVYTVAFDFAPRLLNSFGRNAVLSALLPAFPRIYYAGPPAGGGQCSAPIKSNF